MASADRPRAVAAAAAELGGEAPPQGFWDTVRDLSLEPLNAPRLWRLSVPRTISDLGLGGQLFRDWAGGQVWLTTDQSPDDVRAAAAKAGGHATVFRGAEPGQAVFSPLTPSLLALHQRLKAVFDPAGIFNPGRMYEEL